MCGVFVCSEFSAAGDAAGDGLEGWDRGAAWEGRLGDSGTVALQRLRAQKRALRPALLQRKVRASSEAVRPGPRPLTAGEWRCQLGRSPQWRAEGQGLSRQVRGRFRPFNMFLTN